MSAFERAGIFFQEGGRSLEELRVALGAESEVALSNAMKLGWIRLDKETKKAQVQPVAAGRDFEDWGRACLSSVGKWQEEANQGERRAEELLLQALKNLQLPNAPERILQVRVRETATSGTSLFPPRTALVVLFVSRPRNRTLKNASLSK